MKTKEFIDRWLKTAVVGNVKANTYAAYRGYTDGHISGTEIAGMNLADIQRTHVQNFIKNLKNTKTGEKLSPKSVRLIYAMFKTALNYALEYGYIDKNPCGKIRLPRLEEKEIRALTLKEQQRIEEAVQNGKKDRAFGITLSLYTGLRVGEICALKWADIDLDRKELRVRKSVCRVRTFDDAESAPKTEMREDTPKTERSRRTVSIPSFLIKELKEQKRRRKSEYIISMSNGRAVQPRTLQGLFNRLAVKCGLEQKNFHVLRHTFATRAIELGVDIATLSGILGHSNTTITYNLYVHAQRESRISAAKAFDKYHLQHIKKERKTALKTP